MKTFFDILLAGVGGAIVVLTIVAPVLGLVWLVEFMLGHLGDYSVWSQVLLVSAGVGAAIGLFIGLVSLVPVKGGDK